MTIKELPKHPQLRKEWLQQSKCEACPWYLICIWIFLFWVILVASFIYNLSAKNRNKSLFWWQCTWLFRDSKTCFVYSYIILAEDVNMSLFFFFFPWLHAAFIIPDEYFHKCKPLGRTGLKQKCEGNFLLILFHPGMAEFWVSRPRFLIFFLISLRKGSVKSGKLPLP